MLYVVLLLSMVLRAAHCLSSDVFSDILITARKSSSKKPDIRLPKTLTPVEYDIRIVPYLGINETFDGHIEILFKVIAPTNQITLHKRHLNVTSLTVRQEGRGEVKVTGTREDEERNFYIIELEGKLERGGEYRVIMSYVGPLRDDRLGFYAEPYLEVSTDQSKTEERWFAATQLQQVYARSMFPCFDEPSFKAVFKVKVSRPGNMFSLSNMPQQGKPTKHVDTPDGIGRFWDEFQPTPVMSTYLLAVVVSEFKNVADVTSKLQLRVFSQASYLKELDFCLRRVPKYLDVLREYTGRNEVVPKIDIVALPGFYFDAMENWGLITFREGYLFVEEGVTKEKEKGLTAYMIAHELAHYWFGNLVTMDWWEYVWLNEGFATYMAYMAMDKADPSWRLDELLMVEKLLPAMEKDGIIDSHPMTSPVATIQGIRDAFDIIAYGKGSCIINMMNHMVSPKTFQAAMQDYLEDRSYNTSTPDILFSHLNARYKKDHPDDKLDVKAVMKTWTHQMGYPVVTVTRNYKDSSARITQERFLFKRNDEASRGYKWFVPLTFTTQRSPDFKATKTADWLKPETSDLVVRELSASPDEWVLFNIRAIGYYRVNYDEANWYLLASYLDSDKFETIPASNRALLIDDAFKLADAGLLSHCVPLSIVKYLKRERDFAPWHVAFDMFKIINERMYYTEGINYLEKYLLGLVSPIYELLGLEAKASDDHLTRMARGEVAEWACRYKGWKCTKDAVETFRRFQKSSVPIDPNVKWTVYCTAMRHNRDEVEPFLKKIKNDPKTPWAEVDFIKNILKCGSYGTRKLASILEEFETSTRGQNVSMRSKVDEDDSVNFDVFLRNIGEIVASLGPSATFGQVLARYFPTFNDQEQVVFKLKKLMRTLNEDQTKERWEIEDAISRITFDSKWRQVSGDLFVDWLKAEVEGSKEERNCTLVKPKTTSSDKMKHPAKRQQAVGGACCPNHDASSGMYAIIIVASLLWWY